jgi:hypothetical protein
MSTSRFRAEPATRVVCAVAALASLCLLVVRLSGVHGSDLPVLMLLVAPYGLLAFQSSHTSTGPESGLALSVIVVVLPLLQLMVVGLFGLVLLLRRLV